MAVALVTLGVTAAASAYAAKKQSSAAKGAAATQAAAGNQALGAQERGYQQARQDFSPYQQAGVSAVDRLNASAGRYTGGPPLTEQQQQNQVMGAKGRAGLGQPPPPIGGGFADQSGMERWDAALTQQRNQQALPRMMDRGAAGQDLGMQGMPGAPGVSRLMDRPAAGQALGMQGMPPGGPQGAPGLGQPPPMSGAPVVPQGQPQGQQGGLLTVQAPTGETMQLPQAQAQQAVAKGARIVTR